MNTLLSFIERLLIGTFVIALVALIVTGFVRNRTGDSPEEAPWKQVKDLNTVEGYLDYLRRCQSCAHEAEAEEALDRLQRPRGLVARLARSHLPARAVITLPVFSPDGRTVLAAGGGSLDFWDAGSGEHLARAETAFPTRVGRYVETLGYSPDGRQIAAGMSGTEGGNLLVWDERSGELLGDYALEGYDVKVVAFAPQGARVGWLAHGPVGVWEPATGKLMRATHQGASALAFVRIDGARSLLLTAAGRELWFWDPLSMELAEQSEFRTERSLLGLSQDGKLILFHDGPVLEAWDTLSGKLLATLDEHDGEITAFCREPRRGWIVVGTKAGSLHLWDIARAKPLGGITAHEGPVEQLACSAQGRAVSVGWDSAKIWDLDRLKAWATQHPPA
jgi:WD40 repeat protein